MNQEIASFRKAAADLDLSAEKTEDLLDAPSSTEGVPELGEFGESGIPVSWDISVKLPMRS